MSRSKADSSYTMTLFHVRGPRQAQAAACATAEAGGGLLPHMVSRTSYTLLLQPLGERARAEPPIRMKGIAGRGVVLWPIPQATPGRSSQQRRVARTTTSLCSRSRSNAMRHRGRFQLV